MKSKALLIIDMQKGSFTPSNLRYETELIVSRINDLASKFRSANLPVIYIQHDGTTGGEFIPDTTEWELLDELIVESTDIIIDKYANDSFYHSELGSTLAELNVRNLVVMGCATDFCVESTIQSALSKDFNITVVADGHTTANRPQLTAKQVIDHYNWVWQGLIPTKGVVNVVESKKLFL